jgi:hypothetical protein
MANNTEEEVVYDGQIAYKRKKKDNSLIEMGARVVNASFEVRIDEKHIMKRLYVVHTEDLNSDNARKLQDNGYVNDPSNLERQARAIMYSQMGSCFANPFHRLGDALEYVMNVRKSRQMVDTDDNGTPDKEIREIYKDVRFEIFLTNGTFYPYRNAYGMQAASRSNTFVIPEMVSIIGGVDCDEPYGQEGYGEIGIDGTPQDIEVKGESAISLKCMHTRTIRSDRKQSDLNMNNVVEPWELDNQSILSGNVISGTETKNAYHVITCYPDANKVGLLPTIKDDNDDELPMPSSSLSAGEQKQKYLVPLASGENGAKGFTIDYEEPEDLVIRYSIKEAGLSRSEEVYDDYINYWWTEEKTSSFRSVYWAEIREGKYPAIRCYVEPLPRGGASLGFDLSYRDGKYEIGYVELDAPDGSF